MSGRSRRFTKVLVPTPEIDAITSQLKYLRNLKKGIRKEETRVAKAHEAIPKLQNLLAQRREDIKIISGVLADLMRLQAQPGASPEYDWENPFLVPALSAQVEYCRLTRCAAEAKKYHQSLSDSLSVIKKQIDTARSVISATGSVLPRMQGIRTTMLESIRLLYALIHPIHRLCDDTLAYIFLLIVSEKFEAARMFRGEPEDCPKLHAPAILASVCSTWGDIAYNCPSLWKRVVVTDVSPLWPYWRNRAVPPIAVVAVGDSLFGSDHARLVSRTAIDDLTFTSKRLGLIRFGFDLSYITSIQRLTIASSEFQDFPTYFPVPTAPSSLSS